LASHLCPVNAVHGLPPDPPPPLFPLFSFSRPRNKKQISYPTRGPCPAPSGCAATIFDGSLLRPPCSSCLPPLPCQRPSEPLPIVGDPPLPVFSSFHTAICIGSCSGPLRTFFEWTAHSFHPRLVPHCPASWWFRKHPNVPVRGHFFFPLLR